MRNAGDGAGNCGSMFVVELGLVASDGTGNCGTRSDVKAACTCGVKNCGANCETRFFVDPDLRVADGGTENFRTPANPVGTRENRFVFKPDFIEARDGIGICESRLAMAFLLREGGGKASSGCTPKV